MLDDERKAYDPKLTIGRIFRYFYQVNVFLVFKLIRNNKIKICFFDKFVGGVFVCLGERRVILTTPEIYKGLFAM